MDQVVPGGMTMRAFAMMSLVLLLGCGKKQPSIDEAIAAWQPKVGAKLDTIREIASRPPSFERARGGGVIDIYELASGKDLGRRGYSVVGSSEVIYKTDSSGVGSSIAADEAIGRDYQKQTHRAIEYSLAGTGP